MWHPLHIGALWLCRYNPVMSPVGDTRSERMRAIARQIFQSALMEASVARAFEKHVSCERGVLRICDDLYDLNSYSRVFVVSVGKAAHTMLTALTAQAGDRFEGIVASPVTAEPERRGFRYFQGGHPLPNAESVRAASAILKSVASLDSSALAIFLLSGGGSAIAEKPLDEEVTLADLISTYKTLVLCGARIGEINAIRKHLSAIKGGRLARAAFPAQQVSILISDVPDNTPDALASGPTMPDSTTVDQCYAIAAKHALIDQMPPSVGNLLRDHALEETPKSGDEAFHRSRWWTLLSNKTVVDAAAAEATRAGFSVTVDNSCDDWDYAQAAEYLLTRLEKLRKKGGKICLLSGGEVTVKVTNGGVGGRNQQFALACAAEIAGKNIAVLSAGSDGIDGNSPAAGGIVDGTTALRAREQGLPLESHLANFDAYPVFDALGDSIVTGPTGNNVRDIRILLAY